MIELIGYLAALIDVAQFAPQLWRAFSRRRDREAMRGFSLVAYALATTQATLWVVYGFATERLPVALPNVFIAPACGYVFVQAARARLRSRAGAVEPSAE